MDSCDELVDKKQCPRCAERGADNSGDNLAVYADGHTHCYACGYHESGMGNGGVAKEPDEPPAFIPLDHTAQRLEARRISRDTCERFGYGVGRDDNGNAVQICDVRDERGNLVAQKIRGRDKQFRSVGSLKDKPLIGMHLWSGGKRLVITEGEIDMLSYGEITKCKWPVVSLPNGAQSARSCIAKNLDYCKQFDEVVILFDMDEPGQAAATECADLLLSVTDVKLAKLPKKDANECLVEGLYQEVQSAVWNAHAHMPDGLLTVEEIIERMKQPKEKGLPWFMDGLNASSNGRVWGQVISLGAGTGVGKTDLLLQQMDFDVRHLHQKVAGFFLENDPEEVVEIMCGKADGRLYHEENHPHYDMVEEKLAAARKYSGRLYLYDNFGMCDWDSIKAKILFLITQGYRVHYIDHLTALATGGDKNEKEELERIMAEVAEIAKRHDILIHLVSHLTTPDGASHEEGGRVTIKQYKGSRAIGFWSHQMIGLERNQQADGDERFVTTARQLKRRGFGKGVGKTTRFRYDPDTGLLKELTAGTEPTFHDEDEPF